VPRLLIHRITKGIYYDLLDAFHEPDRNLFADWFGYAFEEYGGIILQETLDPLTVFHEPVYRTSVKRGPDWTVLEGKTGLAMEFRSSRLPKSIRTKTEREEVLKHVSGRLGHAAALLPGKIQDILDGTAGLPASKTNEIVPAIVTLEPWFPEALTVELIRTKLQKEGQEVGRFNLMSIDDLEWLLTWAEHETPAVVLRDKLCDPSLDGLSVGRYLRRRADDLGLPFPKHILKDKSDDFFGEWLGVDDGRESH
jgi:hypothetical protein